MLRRLRRYTSYALSIILLAPLTGCNGFFVYPGATGSGAGTGTGTSPSYAYVANASSSTIAAFSLSTGTPTPISGSPYAVGLSPTSIVVTPANSFVYVGAIGAIFGFSIGTGGVLTPISSGAALAAAPAVAMDVSPDGKWLFVLDASGVTLDEYAINASTGALTVATGASFAVSGGISAPSMVRVSPNGAYVVAAMGTGGDVVFTFNTTTGLLTAVQTLAGATRTNDNAVAFDPTSSHLYIARSGDNSGVAAFTIASAGALTSIAGSPFPAGAGPYALTFDSTGAYLYVANRIDGTLSGFAVTASGVLTSLSGSPYVTGAVPTSMGRDSSGKYIVAVALGGSPDLSVYSFDTATAGKLVTKATTSTGTSPTGAVGVALTH